MARFFDWSIDNISLHLKNIFKDEELNENSVIENSSITASDDKNYKTKMYNLDAIIAIGYRVNSKKQDTLLVLDFDKFLENDKILKEIGCDKNG